MHWSQEPIHVLVNQFAFLLDELADGWVLEGKKALPILGDILLGSHTVILLDDVVLASALVTIRLGHLSRA